MHSLVNNIIEQAKSNLKTIVLPESDEPRILEAAASITKQKIAQIITIGDPTAIQTLADKHKINLTGVNIIDPKTYQDTDKLVSRLYELRKGKGLSLEDAKKLMESPLYFGTMLVKQGLADGMVAGANTTTADTFKPALQIIKVSPENNLVSTFFLMIIPQSEFGQEGLMFFADCALNLDPNPDQLAEIAIQTGDSFKRLTNTNPKIALLSYSTHDSGHGPSVDKVKQATSIAQKLRPNLLVEGEVQADTAINPPTCSIKCPECTVTGDANVLIFPDLNSANISYKLVQRLAKSQAFGPISQGLNKPISDLSRGCSVEDIIITTAITCIQSTPTGR